MARHVCSSFTIKNDNGSEVKSQVDSIREISEYYSVSDSLITPVFALYHPNGNFLNCNDQYSVDYNVENLMELVAHDTEWVGNTGWNKLEYWMCLLGNQ